ncbi:MAG: M48 family metalloprotease, partial [Planctomycetia bacterium]|nr:M48 family metalloprotease [Planctomycetia bacterium]
MGRFACRLLLCAAISARCAASSVAGPEVQPSDLTVDVIRRIDQAARDRPLESRVQNVAGFHGDVVSWLVSRAPLSPAEEVDRAAALHAEICGARKVVPTPVALAADFQALTARMPPDMRPAEFRFTLTVLDEPERKAFSGGGGFVYITRSLLKELYDEGAERQPRLDFCLARELGHIGLGHCRRGHELKLLEDESKRGIDLGIDRDVLRSLLHTAVAAGGSLARFLYTPQQEFAADLFALHLCRNARHDTDRALDAIRYECLRARPDLAAPAEPGVERPAAGPRPADQPDPFLRLKRLQMELSGEPDSAAAYGLFIYDRETSEFRRAAEQSLAVGDRAVVFIHGLEGNGGFYLPLMKEVARNQRGANLEFFEFRFPNDQSLARSGEYLTRELARVCTTCRDVDFVCHSAGGLVFRYFAEVHNGEFCKAIFQATPHAGSELARLRTLLEAGQFLKGLKLGFPESLEQAILDGRGQIAYDLHPGSLFLEYMRAASCGELHADEIPAREYEHLRRQRLGR